MGIDADVAGAFAFCFDLALTAYGCNLFVGAQVAEFRCMVLRHQPFVIFQLDHLCLDLEGLALPQI